MLPILPNWDAEGWPSERGCRRGCVIQPLAADPVGCCYFAGKAHFLMEGTLVKIPAQWNFVGFRPAFGASQ